MPGDLRRRSRAVERGESFLQKTEFARKQTMKARMAWPTRIMQRQR